jgi:serine/threonine-protein kinase
VDEFQLAIELNPGYAEAYHWRSTLYGMLGRIEEALQEKARALSLDPLSVVIRTDVARLHYFRRDYDKALEKYRLALDMDANFASAHLWMAQVYEQKGLFEAAISELEAGCRLDGESAYALARLGHGYASSGKTADAHKVLKQLEEISAQRYVSPYDLAVAHIALQQNEQAFSWLEKAIEHRSTGLGYLRVEPQLDSLRPDARFDELIRRVGLN